MKYNMYQELVDKINELNKENKRYKDMIKCVPTRVVRMLAFKEKNKDWSEEFNERLRAR